MTSIHFGNHQADYTTEEMTAIKKNQRSGDNSWLKEFSKRISIRCLLPVQQQDYYLHHVIRNETKREIDCRIRYEATELTNELNNGLNHF